MRGKVDGVCDFVCMTVRALKGKRLELSTPNLIHIYSACVEPEIKMPKVQGHAVIKRAAGVWVCKSIRLLRFLLIDCHPQLVGAWLADRVTLDHPHTVVYQSPNLVVFRSSALKSQRLIQNAC